jgi:hypothetical protein
LDEAEQLMQGVFLRFSASTGHEHPFLHTATRNYVALLAEMGRDSGQSFARLNNLARQFGISFSSDALSEIVRQSPERRTLQSSVALSGYHTALTFFRKAVSLLGFAGSKVQAFNARYAVLLSLRYGLPK